jgi:hypothetical protein
MKLTFASSHVQHYSYTIHHRDSRSLFLWRVLSRAGGYQCTVQSRNKIKWTHEGHDFVNNHSTSTQMSSLPWWSLLTHSKMILLPSHSVEAFWRLLLHWFMYQLYIMSTYFVARLYMFITQIWISLIWNETDMFNTIHIWLVIGLVVPRFSDQVFLSRHRCRRHPKHCWSLVLKPSDWKWLEPLPATLYAPRARPIALWRILLFSKVSIHALSVLHGRNDSLERAKWRIEFLCGRYK